MNRIHLWFLTAALLAAPVISHAQETGNARSCMGMKHRLAGKTTVADPAEESYDMKYVKLDLTMTNTATTLSGNATTRAVVSVASMSAYVFELNSLLTIDSLLFNGVNSVFTSAGDLRTVALGTPLTTGTSFAVQVFYHGTPTSGTLMETEGINTLSSPSWGTTATFTLSESYHAKEWWPCKQSLHDKIDSADIWITVADSLKAGSNGMLTAITPIDASHVRYEWKERYPIDYYLISAAVGPYTDYSYYMHFTGSTDSMLVQNYVYNNPATLTSFKSVIDSTGMMIDYLSTLYGRYPFWHEKYGHSMGALSGGMEHQTMTTLGFFEGTLVAHELGHQWFGDNATCGTWADIFMNEGFAGYTENLFIDHFRTHAQAIADMQTRQTDVKSIAGGTIYVDDTTSEDRIFDSRLSYDKGACVLHMLRFITSNDSAFFEVYKNYQQQKTGSTGTIMDFKNTMEATLATTVNGINLDTFFNQWFYLEGYPEYTIHWNQTGSDVYVQLQQSTSVPSSVPLFTMPMELKLHAATGDTIVRIINDQALQQFHFSWDRSMIGMAVDPNYWLVYKLSGLTHDPSLGLGVSSVAAPVVHIAPNPATSSWQATDLPLNSTLLLTDVTGRTIWQGSNNNTTMTIPASSLAAGVYILKVYGAGNAVSSYKLVKE